MGLNIRGSMMVDLIRRDRFDHSLVHQLRQACSATARSHVHAADRLRLVPATDAPPRADACKQLHTLDGCSWFACSSQPWPFDNTLPVGLPRLPVDSDVFETLRSGSQQAMLAAYRRAPKIATIQTVHVEHLLDIWA